MDAGQLPETPSQFFIIVLNSCTFVEFLCDMAGNSLIIPVHFKNFGNNFSLNYLRRVT